MKWASELSDKPGLDDAIGDCVASINRQMDGVPADLAVIFVSAHHEVRYEDIPGMVREQLGTSSILGCSGGGIIGNGQEVEQQPAVSITAASLPGVTIKGVHIQGDALPDLDAGPNSWEDVMQVSRSDDPQFVILADPFSFPVQNLILGMDFAFEQSAKIGGLASGARQQGQNALFLNDQVFRSGAVGIALHGNIVVDTVVAQGCRPIGQPMRITGSQRNLLQELDGKRPLDVLRELFQELTSGTGG